MFITSGPDLLNNLSSFIAHAYVSCDDNRIERFYVQNLS